MSFPEIPEVDAPDETELNDFLLQVAADEGITTLDDEDETDD